MALHPDFPVVSGSYQMTDEWSATLPEGFNRRIEDGSLVLWRPELTFWINVWGTKDDASLEKRLAAILDRSNPQRTDEQVERSSTLVRVTYEVPEHDPTRRVPNYKSISGHVLAPASQVQISAYYDSKSARSLAYQVIHSVQSAA
jgi:hypothetical protein